MGIIRYTLPLVLVTNLNAMLLFSLQDVGSDLVLTASGSVDSITGLTVDTINQPGGNSNMQASAGLFVAGTGTSYNQYSNVSGPNSIGPGGGFGIATGGSSGPFAGINGSGGGLYTQGNYVVGTPINSTSTWTGASLASYGITPGVYTWTWGGGSGDSAVLYAGVTPIPEPATYIALAGFCGLGLFVWRRRKRVHQSAA